MHTMDSRTMRIEDYKSVMEIVLLQEANEIKQLITQLDSDIMYSIVSMLGNCKGRIFTTGCGTSAAAAKKIAHSLCCVERSAAFLNPSDAVHGGLGLLHKDDVLIILSKGGNTAELLKLLPACKTKGVHIIAVGENEQSSLAKSSDFFLRIRVEKEPCPFGLLATASTLCAIAAFDSICIALMYYTDYTREQFHIIHPSGAVGEKLSFQDSICRSDD